MVWVDVLKHAETIFQLKNPGLVSIPLSFAVALVVSLARREPAAEEKFVEVRARLAGGTVVER